MAAFQTVHLGCKAVVFKASLFFFFFFSSFLASTTVSFLRQAPGCHC